MKGQASRQVRRSPGDEVEHKELEISKNSVSFALLMVSDFNRDVRLGLGMRKLAWESMKPFPPLSPVKGL